MRNHLIQTNGVTLAVADLGQGPPVLFCHGFPAIAASWSRQMEVVATAGYRALAPDMRGYGGSSAPDAPEAYTPFHTVGDLVGILDHLGLPDCVIVGHDFGANVAWTAAMMRPDRFRAVFGMSVPFRQPGGPSFLDRLKSAGRNDFYMFAQMRPEAETAWANAAITIPGFYHRSSGRAPAGERWELFNAASMHGTAPDPLPAIDSAYLAAAIHSFQTHGFRGPLNYYRAINLFFEIASGAYAGASIQQPSWFLTGAMDPLRAFEPPAEVLRQGLPNLLGTTVLDGVGHWPQWEAVDDVNRALFAFLRQVMS